METFLLTVGAAVLVVSLGLASASDLSSRTIPNACVAGTALAATPLVASALLAAAASFSRRVHGRDGVGAGDIKLLGALGLWAGPVGGLAVVGASCLIALAGRAAVLWVRQSASRVALCRGGAMPMAPAIFAAALLTYALGLWAW